MSWLIKWYKSLNLKRTDLLTFILAVILGTLSIRELLTSLDGLFYLFLSGLLLGFLRPGHPWLWGFGTVFLFPIVSVIDIFIDPPFLSHNLSPLEPFIYGFMAMPAVIGAYIGRFLRLRNVR